MNKTLISINSVINYLNICSAQSVRLLIQKVTAFDFALKHEIQVNCNTSLPHLIQDLVFFLSVCFEDDTIVFILHLLQITMITYVHFQGLVSYLKPHTHKTSCLNGQQIYFLRNSKEIGIKAFIQNTTKEIMNENVLPKN